MAKILRHPDKQQRLLFEQKYPKGEPQRYRTPYYQLAISGIRRFYASANSQQALATAHSNVEGIAQETRRINNHRVLDRFAQSSLRERRLHPEPNSRYSAQIGDVHIRLSPDLQATEAAKRRILYFNCGCKQLDQELARYTIEIGLCVLKHQGIAVDPDQIEFIDFFSGTIHTVTECRPGTIARITDTSRSITEMWPDL